MNIQSQAEYTLALTGTPWRSDQAPIALSRYTDPDNQIQCDYIYGLREAVADGVCRSPKIVLIDNERISVTDEENETKTFNGLDALFKGSLVTYQSIIKNDVAIRHALTLATNKLDDIRLHNPNAAGLVVASSIEHATYILNMLRNEYAQTAEVVTYKEDLPSLKINEFRSSTTNWIVSVGMISEGTDIPRLHVCCHLSRVKTELYFRQVLGRILRVNKAINQEAWLYTFAAPKLVEFANRIAEEIPDVPVIFRESETVTVSAVQGGGDIIRANSSSQAEHKVRFSTPYKNESQFPILAPPNNRGLTWGQSPSFEILGGFREKVVSTFNSPF
ncbi:diguanylate cyclase [Shewanella sp. Isolate13]|uniref:DEAD/DEAH box helicase n=1 Tax=Shewanella sp. Isolate13 TaxID=2908531 RepID=UPI001EFD2885|nr:diguanylate cyclase [Shewanella sp. Isolate13]MCG9731358.1 diguanylate cyclase [Shewanella sp. Isolate13]